MPGSMPWSATAPAPRRAPSPLAAPAPTAPRAPEDLAALQRRLDGMEAKLARRERVFQRLLDLLAVSTGAASGDAGEGAR